MNASAKRDRSALALRARIQFPPSLPFVRRPRRLLHSIPPISGGSFAVHFGDHLRSILGIICSLGISGDHFRSGIICGAVHITRDMCISLGICVWGYTYHGETHIGVLAGFPPCQSPSRRLQSTCTLQSRKLFFGLLTWCNLHWHVGKLVFHVVLYRICVPG